MRQSWCVAATAASLLANEHFRAEATARGIGFFASAQERTHDEIEGNGVVSYFYLKSERIREYFQQPRMSLRS